MTFGGPQARGHSLEDTGSPRGARSQACRVHTRVNTILFTNFRAFTGV
jgi:hypothetical protein